jgi:hypothetical protein
MIYENKIYRLVKDTDGCDDCTFYNKPNKKCAIISEQNITTSSDIREATMEIIRECDWGRHAFVGTDEIHERRVLRFTR